MSTVVKDLGAVSAYAYAVEKGYTGTEAEFAELMADYAEVGQRAEDSADSALESKTAAQTAATTATTKAAEASTSASTATSAKDTAVSASQTATTKATEATTAAATAVSAKDDAVTANTAAQSAKTAAQTAQTGAETAAASVQSSAAQIATNTEDITQLKNTLSDMQSDGVVPSAEQILSDKGVTDSVPYHYRKTGGDGADRLYDKIVGGSLAVNQLVQNGDFSNGSDRWSLYMATAAFDNNIATVVTDDTVNVNSGGSLIQTGITVFANHKYIVSATIKGDGEHRIALRADGGFSFNAIVNVSNDFKIFDGIAVGVSDPSSGRVVITAYGPSMTILVKNVKLFDLTAMFGTTIADYIYQLEQTTEGAGVAFFKSLFPNDYYPYNSGELVSVQASAHKMTGLNQWDEEWELGTYNTNTGKAVDKTNQIRSKGFIPVIPSTSYYVRVHTDNSKGGLWIQFYDKNKNIISKATTDHKYNNESGKSLNYKNNIMTLNAECHYIKFYCETTYGATYNHDICINISSSRNGEYEPYKAHSYPLDSSLTLRGIPKLVDGKVCFDGDVYEYTGKITRNTILRAYQSGDESLANAITDGTNTVVYSANASTEQAQPYQHLQQCDPNGTEEYVSTGIVPIGHNSFYPENLRAKIEELPWDLSMIAPIETGTTASRAYEVGKYFLLNHQFCKAKTAIASGATFTLNTNYEITTVADELYMALHA